MNRKLGLLFAIGFITVQVLSTLHTASYGFGEHKHNQRICDVYLHCEQVKYSTPGAPIPLLLPEYTSFITLQPEFIFVRSKAYITSSPRAPPLFS
jgi:hypothetical protein